MDKDETILSLFISAGSFPESYGIEKKVRDINTLEIMLKFIPVFEIKGARSSYNKLKSFLVCKLYRGIKPEEEKRLLWGILKYIQSESASNQRAEAMNYLFNLKFLDN